MVLSLLALVLVAGGDMQAATDTRVTVTKILDVRSKDFRSRPEGADTGFVDPNQQPRFVVEMDLDGSAAGAAIRYGHFKIDDARDNLGKPIQLRKQDSSFGAAGDGWVEIDRETMFFFENEKPKDKLRLELQLEPPARSAEKIALLQGSLKLLTIARRAEVVIDGVGGYIGQELQHEALATSGVRIRLLSKEQAAGSMWIGGDDNSSVNLEIAGTRDNLIDLRLTDAAGQNLSNGILSMESNGNLIKALQCDGALPADARLNITVGLGAQEVAVPFKLENLALP